jgi:hypothetical protein
MLHLNKWEINSLKLHQIDSIARHGIKENAYPGCQIVAIKNGKVFYQKNLVNKLMMCMPKKLMIILFMI